MFCYVIFYIHTYIGLINTNSITKSKNISNKLLQQCYNDNRYNIKTSTLDQYNQ